MSPNDKRHTLGMTIEEMSLAVLAVLGIVGLAYFIATALEVLPIISASWSQSPPNASQDGLPNGRRACRSIERRRNRAAQAVPREHG